MHASDPVFLKIIIPGAAGYVMDLLAGDPAWIYHPVRLIGKLVSFLEHVIRKVFPGTAKGEAAGGAVLAVLTCGFTGLAAVLLLKAADALHPAAGIILRCILCWLLLAQRSLRTESMKVYDRLKEGDIPGARKDLSMIVGRDTGSLDEAGIARAAVETVAENASDGVVAPMLYMLIGGPAAGWIYKAVNTMDSMVGYKNEKYLYFGRFAARLDDLANLIPARLCALFMILASALTGMDMRGAAKIYRRDRYRHASPNSAQTESVMAGALGVRLAGDASYFGKVVHKPYIGDDTRPVEAEDIKRANRLMAAGCGTAFLAMLALRIAAAAAAGV